MCACSQSHAQSRRGARRVSPARINAKCQAGPLSTCGNGAINSPFSRSGRNNDGDRSAAPTPATAALASNLCVGSQPARIAEPAASRIAHWKALQDWIENSYPGTFIPEWIYGGKKHGWSLRYKKSRAFCTFLPEYRLFSVVVVLGRAERDKLEARRESLSSQLADLYVSTPTYRDGKWLKIGVSTADDLRDLTELLTIKRPPRSRH